MTSTLTRPTGAPRSLPSRRALADADATVVSGYLSGGDESTAARQRYDDDIAAAASGLAAAAGRADDPATADRVAELARQLPVYAGLIEQARANNRQGLPVGASYLGRASDLMQGEQDGHPVRGLPLFHPIERTESGFPPVRGLPS
jgi:hypothetical protein